MDVEACDGVVQQGKVFAGQSETGEDGFAVEQGGYFVGFEAAVEQFQHLFQRVEQGTAAAEFDVGYGIRQRPSALFAEDGFDEGDVGFDVGREDGDVVGLQVGMAVELLEQVFFEDLQFAQRAVGADDADAVVESGRAVGQGEGLDVVLQAVEEAVLKRFVGVHLQVGMQFAFGQGVEEVPPLFAQRGEQGVAGLA